MGYAAPAQRIFVVGGNRGVGFELVKRLSAAGHVVTASYRACTRHDESVAQLRSTGVRTVELDVADELSVATAVRSLGQEPLDILINVAGVYQLWDDKPFTEQTAADLMWHFQVNVVGQFLTSKYLLPALQRSTTGGRIINVSSDYASIGDNHVGGNLCYRLSKTAVNQFTRTVALDFQHNMPPGTPQVKLLAVHPGYVATKMTGFYGEDDMDECMTGLVGVIQRFGQPGEEEALPNGGYVRWNGEKMAY